MYYSDSIITAMQANRILALKLEEALTGVKENVIANLKQMGDGLTRATYYTACFTENYQDVCANLKHEDVRFIAGLIQLIKDRNVVFEMIRLYIEIYFKNKQEESVQHIIRKLVSAGVCLSSSGLTNRLLITAVATAVYQSYHFSSLVNARINRAKSIVLKGSVTTAAVALNVYGIVQAAADSADNLKKLNAFYYSVLYERNLEMMYFLIEPVITKNPYSNPMLISDEELADFIIRMAR